MFSIIVCSINPDNAQTLKQSIEATASMPFELIVFDNRQSGLGICQVYNQCAERAKYDYLCFVHEDILFHSKGWDAILAGKLSEDSCGVIGFAGGTAKYPYLYGWQNISTFCQKHYLRGDGTKSSLRSSKSKSNFSEVVTLDGMCLCVRADVWGKHPFDAATFRGFHSYDTDFTTALFVAGYKNYVCHNVVLEHRSTGSFSKGWLESVKIYLNKWSCHLPLYVASAHTPSQIKRKEAAAEAFALKKLMSNHLLSKSEGQSAVQDFRRRHPYCIETLPLLIKLKKLR
ncbi:MAG: hypothetical protein IIV68_07245 [Alistipes sp.]|nr:hypothetical protein [Alistipes sp.]